MTPTCCGSGKRASDPACAAIAVWLASYPVRVSPTHRETVTLPVCEKHGQKWANEGWTLVPLPEETTDRTPLPLAGQRGLWEEREGA